MQQIKKSLKESETAPPKEEEVKPAGVSETISDEPLAPPQISMSSSLTEADMEVSELFSHDESFCPIKESKSDIIGIKGAKCIEQNDEEEAPVTEKEDETTNDDEMLPESDKKNELEYDVNDEKDESKEEIPEDCVSEQKDETPPELPKQTSPQVDEQCTPSVFKMVEHFAQRIQAEQQLIERPVSPKTENVLRRSRWSQIYDDPVLKIHCQSSEQQPPEDPEASNDLASVQRKISEIQEGVTMKSSDTNLEDAQTEDGPLNRMPMTSCACTQRLPPWMINLKTKGIEQTSHPNDERFEETMFELSDDEEQKKSEVHVDVSKSSAAKPEPVKKESDTDVVVKMRKPEI
nr:sterile alpha motif domain-containing protein 15-like [Penaeus vannamei]